MDSSKLYISTIAKDAAALAAVHGFGLEIAEYCTAWNMDEKFDEVHPTVLQTIDGVPDQVLHATYNELFPCAIDLKPENLRLSATVR